MGGALGQSLTAVIVALLSGGGIFGIFYGRKTVKAQAESINIATAQNVVTLVNTQMEHLERQHAHDQKEWEKRIHAKDLECDTKLAEMAGHIRILESQVRKLLSQ